MKIDILVPTREEDKNWLILGTEANKLPDDKRIGRLFRDSLVPLCEEGEQIINSRLTYRLVEGVVGDIEGAIKVFIKGISYRLNDDYTSIFELNNYGILAWLTKDYLIHPCLRQSHFYEKKVNRNTWPIILPLENANGGENGNS